MDKKTLSEREICAKFITPAITASGCSTDLQMRDGDSLRWARRRARQQASSQQEPNRKAAGPDLYAQSPPIKQAHMAEALISEAV